MTNAEKYKQQIEKIKKTNEDAKSVLACNLTTKELIRCGCNSISCDKCLFFWKNYKNGTLNGTLNCTYNCEDWLQSEYEEHLEE